MGCKVANKAIFLIVTLFSLLQSAVCDAPVHSNASCIGSISAAEFSFLQELYYSTQGDYWLWNKNKPVSTEWQFPSNATVPCTQAWQGLNCTDSLVLTHQCNISSIVLANHQLRGHLPPSIGNLSSLEHIFLNNNYLSGVVPVSMTSLRIVKNIFLYNNLFTGTVPTQFAVLTQLEVLELYENLLTGTLPAAYSSLQLLQILGLVSNFLVGTIPSQYGELRSLEYLYLYDNGFTGTIPSELGNLKNTIYFGLHSNRLQGTIPTTLGMLGNVTQFTIGYNSLHGTIPVELGLMKRIQNLELLNNFLTGTVPTELGQLTRVFNFVLQNNFLSGTLSSELLVKTMGSFDLSSNLLTGCLPESVERLKILESIDVGYNYLSWSIPSQIATSSILKSLSVNSNYFSGTLPSKLNELKVFQALNASDNFFEGNLTELFPPTTASSRSQFPRLKSLSMSSNKLTGTIPNELFKSDLLQIVVLYSNCFAGSLTNDMCLARNLTTLIFDSIDGAPSCDINFPSALSFLFQGFLSGGDFGGSIPSCLWSMPNLVTLHLSGNGLTGTLSDLSVNSSLRDVTIASNNIVGTLPQSFQTQGQFTQLDLSFNRITGTLSTDFACSSQNQVLDLTVNRLSGRIPSDLMDQPSLNILNGNLFQCQEKNKPEFDPTSDQYVCGSNDLNISLILWVVIFAVTALLLIWMIRYQSKQLVTAFNFTILKELSYFYMHILSSSLSFTARFVEITRIFYICTLFIVSLFIVVALFAFLLMKLVHSLASQYSTHADQYMWVTTSAYLHGYAPTAVIVVCLYVCVVVVRIILRPAIEATAVPPEVESTESSVDHVTTKINEMRRAEELQQAMLDSQGFTWSKLRVTAFNIFMSASMQLINIVVTLVVNVGYVYAIFQGLSFWSLSVVQLLLGIYKIVWVNGIMSMIIRRLDFLTPAQQLQHRTFMSLFTFIAGPFLATFFSDSLCFRYLITGNPQIYSSFDVDLFGCQVNCVTYVGCITLCEFSDQNPSTVQTIVTPGWLYSYQCFSALLSNYIPVLVVSFMFSGIVVPCLLLAYLHLSPESVERVLPDFIREVVLVDTIHMHVHGEDADMQSYLDRVSTIRLTETSMINKMRRPLFNANVVITKLLLNLTMLVTFGLSGPLFAIIVCVDSFSVTMLWRILVGRYMLMWNSSDGNSDGVNAAAYVRLERATRHSAEGIDMALYMVFIFAGMFWSLGLFDMIADVYGSWTGGLVTLVSWLGLPLVYWLMGRPWKPAASTGNGTPGHRSPASQAADPRTFVSDDWALRNSFSLWRSPFRSQSRANSSAVRLQEGETNAMVCVPNSSNEIEALRASSVSSIASTPSRSNMKVNVVSVDSHQKQFDL